MNEEVKNEEPFKMQKHKAIAMMEWSRSELIDTCKRTGHSFFLGHYLIRVTHFFFSIQTTPVNRLSILDKIEAC